MRWRSVTSNLVAVAVVVVLLVGCGGGGSDASDATTTTKAMQSAPGQKVSGEIRVAAAASLTDAFTELARTFEKEHPGTKVLLDFGPSSGLADGIIAGSPADVFASADRDNMDKLVAAGEADAQAPALFAANAPEIAVPKGNPGRVTGLADLAKPDLLVGLCAEEVPCGKFARAVLVQSQVVPAVDTNEPDVRALLGKIASGDLDVGIVYHSDVVAAGSKVEGIEIPDETNLVTTYPVAVLTGAKNGDGASAFADFVASPAALPVLTRFGFLAP